MVAVTMVAEAVAQAHQVDKMVALVIHGLIALFMAVVAEAVL